MVENIIINKTIDELAYVFRYYPDAEIFGESVRDIINGYEPKIYRIQLNRHQSKNAIASFMEYLKRNKKITHYNYRQYIIDNKYKDIYNFTLIDIDNKNINVELCVEKFEIIPITVDNIKVKLSNRLIYSNINKSRNDFKNTIYDIKNKIIRKYDEIHFTLERYLNLSNEILNLICNNNYNIDDKSNLIEKVDVADKIDETDKCIICYENFDEDKTKVIAKTKCNHFYHVDCLYQNINKTNKNCCPLCKKCIEIDYFINLNGFHNIRCYGIKINLHIIPDYEVV